MATNKWSVDASHSSVEFSVKHMMIAKVKGAFHEFNADIQADPTDLTSASISFSVKTASVDTRSEDRDNHLKSADFFDAENYPEMTFTATNIAKNGEGVYEVTGDFSLHGVTKKETFAVEFEGQGKDPWGNEKAGFSVSGKIKRSDYGLVWNAALETEVGS